MKRLRGLNFGGWLSQIDAIAEKDPEHFPGVDAHMDRFIGWEDILRQRKWGFNHLRLPIDAYHFFDGKGHPVEDRFSVLDRAVRWATEAQLLLIIDLHECPGHDFAQATDIPVQRLFIDQEYVVKTERIWSVIAERYGTLAHVCFEVLNEPVAPDAAVWNDLKDTLCATIRNYAPHSHIVVGSNMWNWPSTYRQMTPVDDDRIIYCFHFYEPLLFTHQNAPWMKEPEIRRKQTYPADYGEGFTRKFGFVHSAGVWNRDRFIREIEPVADFGRRHDAPVICNEFGVYAPVDIGLQVLWLEDLLWVLQEMGIGFTYWNYKNLDFGIISQDERLHADRVQYANPHQTNFRVLETLQAF